LNTHTLPHFEESLQRDIDRIKSTVTEMAKRVEKALSSSIRALIEKDRRLAYSVILRDQYIDELEVELDRLCLEFMIRQQPVAGHLRFVFATIQIIKELERIGDYAESISRQVLRVLRVEPLPDFEKFIALSNLSIPMTHNAMQAYLTSNADLARNTMDVEAEADQLRNTINDDLMKLRNEGKLPFAAFNPLGAIARRLERVTDQAQNICEEVLYMATGEYAKHKGSDVFRILFVDRDNACLSQMAEGVADSLGLPRFLFLSAGLTKQPIDPRTVGFLADKGIDISKQSAKDLSQIPELEYMNVVVELAQGVQAAVPRVSTSKTVVFEWSINDPRQCTGSEKEILAAYDSAYKSVTEHLNELVQAILGEDTNRNV
jgi:phosphate transport system protein